MRKLGYWARYVLARYGSARVVAVLCALIFGVYLTHAIAAPASVFDDIAASNGPDWYQVLTAPIPTYDPSYMVVTATPAATSSTAPSATATDTSSISSGTTVIIINTTVIQQTINGSTRGTAKHHRRRHTHHHTRHHRHRRRSARRTQRHRKA